MTIPSRASSPALPGDPAPAVYPVAWVEVVIRNGMYTVEVTRQVPGQVGPRLSRRVYRNVAPSRVAIVTNIIRDASRISPLFLWNGYSVTGFSPFFVSRRMEERVKQEQAAYGKAIAELGQFVLQVSKVGKGG